MTWTNFVPQRSHEILHALITSIPLYVFLRFVTQKAQVRSSRPGGPSGVSLLMFDAWLTWS